MSRRTELFVDKLSFTISVPHSLRSEVLERFNALAYDDRLVIPNRHSRLREGYRHAFVLPGEVRSTATFQLDSTHVPIGNSEGQKETHRYLRVEYNPHSTPNRNMTVAILSEVLPEYSSEHLANEISITRVDFSIDVFGLPLNQLLISSTLRRIQTSAYIYQQTGQLCGVYYGKLGSSRVLATYDKALELKAAQQNERVSTMTRQNQNTKPPIIRRSRPRVRLELRLYNVGNIESLSQIPNPFSRYLIRESALVASTLKGWQIEFFLAKCRECGMQNALSLIDDEATRLLYRDAVRSVAAPPWFDSDELWSEWPAAIARALTA